MNKVLINEMKIASGHNMKASAAILEVYARDFGVEYKADDSPLTDADRVAKLFQAI